MTGTKTKPRGGLFWYPLDTTTVIEQVGPIRVSIGLDVTWYTPTKWHVESLAGIDYLVVDAWEAQ